MKSLEKRQKHIKMADRSDYGWSTVEHYDSHALADESNDEKRLEKAEREAECAANKRKRGGGAGAKRKCSWNDTGGPSSRREPQPAQTAVPPPLLPQGQFRPQVLGPCFSCGGFGHFAKTCQKKSVYPFSQPVVSSAEVSCVTESAKSRDVNSVDGLCVDSTKSLTPALEVAGIKAVNDQNASDITTNPGNIETCPEMGEPCNEPVVSRFWEAEACMPTSQDCVQGRLKQSLAFWKDVLQAPPSILECIENGYSLPLKFLPPPHSQTNHKSAELHHEFVDEAIQNLVQNRCIIRMDQKTLSL